MSLMNISLSHKPEIFDFSRKDLSKFEDGLELFDWWHKARESNPYPSRDQFSPFKFAACLPNIYILDVAPDIMDFTVRLVGTKVSENYGSDATGLNLKVIPNQEKVIERLSSIVKSGAPAVIFDHPLYWSELNYKKFDILHLPLGDSQEKPTMIMSVLQFKY
ncbi:PAS domain-containing protein [Temperatibacter marinus]|uniref:PAS domain-containing protein n=1 Tax=Temperatibacter marinus TaxID=1456591 RepID=A0AA52HAU7_9PROT|nr:PAS domain-containing protein [Temperatibacter marinus]WND03967.1 PAS domain-containing protein [Temperatibacter marinus]